MVIQFFIPLERIPTITDQQKGLATRKDGKPYAYTTAEVENVKELYRSRVAKYKPQNPIDGPVVLTVKWLFPIPPKSKHRDGQPKITAPDTENMLKALKDSMADVGFFTVDSRVFSEHNEKFWAATPGIFIRVEAI